MLRSLLVAFLMGLTAGGGNADDPKLPGPKINFPEVKDFTRSKIRTFPDAKLGYSIAYSNPSLIATLYVYNKGLEEIPDGAKSKTVKDEMKQVRADLQAAVKQGLYMSAKEKGAEEVVTLGGKGSPEAVRQRFILEVEKVGERESEAYVMGYKNHFLKIRISYAPADREEVGKKIATLLDAIGAAIK